MGKRPTNPNQRQDLASPAPASPNLIADTGIAATQTLSTSCRVDQPGDCFRSATESIWMALSQTPGVGVSITDAEGNLVFVNDTTQALFSESTQIAYEGKTIADFHPPEFVVERLAMIQRVLKEGKPLAIRHIYHGRRIESTIWPIRDHSPPFNRVIVVSREAPHELDAPSLGPDIIETATTNYIDLGPLDILSKRELEVLVLLGNGLSVPRAAALLHRSPKTIERHKASIGKKLQLKGQAEMVAIVTSVGLEISDAKLKRYRPT